MNIASAVRIAFAAILGIAVITPAAAQNYPVRAVRIIAPFPAGGSSDLVARILAQKLTDMNGQQFIVDNRPGAGGTLGTELGAKAAPDGYTLTVGNVAPTAVNFSLFKKLPYDPVNDFAPIALSAVGTTVLVVHPSLPVNSVRELVALAKARPDQLNYASSGIGASAHMAAELFKSMTKTRMVHVAYKGQPPAITDLIAGQTQLMFPNIPSALTQVKAKRLRPLAVTTTQRSSMFPALPTVAEAGVPGFEVTQWGGLVTAAGVPLAITGRFQQDVAAVLAMPEVQKAFQKHGFDTVGNTPAQFATYIRDEIAKWGKIIRDAGIRAD